MGIFYKTMGDGKGIVMIPGYTLNHSIWLRHAEQLSKEYKVVLVDNEGCGQSNSRKGPLTVENMAEDIVEVIEKSHLTDLIL